MDSISKEIQFVTPKNKYKIFYYKIPVSFGSPYVLVLYQITLSTTNEVHYAVLTIHESNTTFPVTRHQFRMMCDKDILQLLFEDLN